MLAEQDLTGSQIDFLDSDASQILIEYSNQNEELKVYILDSNATNNQRKSNHEQDDKKVLLISLNIKI